MVLRVWDLGATRRLEFVEVCANFRTNMRRAIYPGSFDPITNGHLDVIARARKLFDEAVVAVAHNIEKEPLFTLEERLELLRDALGNESGIKIGQFDGLLVDFAVAQ